MNSVTVYGYTIDGKGNRAKCEYSLDTASLTPNDYAALTVISEMPEHKIPVLLSDSELWQEIKMLSHRLLIEMQCNAIATENSPIEKFIPKFYNAACYTMLKMRDCLDEIRKRGFIDDEICQYWQGTELIEAFNVIFAGKTDQSDM